MDFIERIFGISPDGGDGSFELLLLLIPMVAIVAVAHWRRHRALLARTPPGSSASPVAIGNSIQPETMSEPATRVSIPRHARDVRIVAALADVAAASTAD
jgi:hypothetical protein